MSDEIIINGDLIMPPSVVTPVESEPGWNVSTNDKITMPAWSPVVLDHSDDIAARFGHVAQKYVGYASKSAKAGYDVYAKEDGTEYIFSVAESEAMRLRGLYVELPPDFVFEDMFEKRTESYLSDGRRGLKIEYSSQLAEFIRQIVREEIAKAFEAVRNE